MVSKSFYGHRDSIGKTPKACKHGASRRKPKAVVLGALYSGFPRALAIGFELKGMGHSMCAQEDEHKHACAENRRLTSNPKFSGRGLRLVREDESSPYPKAALWLRGCARLVDFLWAGILVFYLENIGVVLAMLYLLFADGFWNGQSPGKRIFGIRVLHVPTRRHAHYRESFLRNAAWGLLLTLHSLPDFGLIAFGIAFVLYGLLESWRVWREPLGLRRGDIWAQTQVVDGKALDKQLAWKIKSSFPSASGRTVTGCHGENLPKGPSP
ncbi:MAG: RDD family protein [Cystobacterineae bacterium]|nr:RDD family protein [Cystobacterineae bacterium]